jgi:signal transduction histidine kinase
VLIAALPYALRRRAPLAVLVVAGVAVFALLLLGHGTAVIGTGLFLGAYTVAARTDAVPTAAAAVFCVVLLGAVAAIPGRMGWPEFATNLALFIGSFALGWGARAKAESTRLLAERAELAERAQEEASRMAVSEERLRIARELHDVVGHSLGVIALQAGVGARVALSDPPEARSSLLAIAERSRASLQEVRQILGALRNPADDAAPSPSLDDLDALVGRSADAGVRVAVTRSGDPWPVSEALGLTAYRVLQESLTNVVKHSGADRAEVVVRYEPDRLVLGVSDGGRGAPPEAREGTGQVGMRERVAVWGGRFRAGNRAGGGYEVVAELPRPEEAER